MYIDAALAISMAVLMTCWLTFILTFLFRKKLPTSSTKKRAPFSWLGMVLQSSGFYVVFGFARWRWGRTLQRLPVFLWGYFQSFSLLSLPPALQDILFLATMPLALASVWVTIAAVRVLGKQWSYEARITAGHRLIVGGPYSHMRHPIYTAMLGMLVATGLCISDLPALFVALVLYAAGTMIRVRAEERLLREAFGADFEAYTRYVPAIFPRLRFAGAVSKP